MKNWFLLLAIAFSSLAHAQEAPEPKHGVDVRVLHHFMDVNAHSATKTTISHSLHYEIYNFPGSKKVRFHKICDANQELTKFSAKVINGAGEVVATYGLKSLKNESYLPSYTLIADTRVKYLEALEPEQYPYELRIEYEESLGSAFYLPDFMPVTSWGMAVDHARLTLRGKAYKNIRCRQVNTNVQFQESEAEGLSLQMQDIPAMEPEPMAPPFLQLAPRVELSPSDFKMGRTEGSFHSWETFGDWIAELNGTNPPFPQKTLAAFEERLSAAQSDREKARLAYEFLQERTRYVSIQLGIGGLKPFSIEEVDRLGYGDCKALSNYMVALLETAGLKAHYTLIYSGRNAQLTTPDFPADNFNHIIVCLPLDQDTVWMECTSQILPFGYLSPSTNDRYALAIENGASKLVRTPQPLSEPSVHFVDIQCKAFEDKSVAFKVSTSGTGVFLGEFCQLAYSSGEQQQDWIAEWHGVDASQVEDTRFGFSDEEGIAKVIFHRKKGAVKAGKYLFLNKKLAVTGSRVKALPNPERRRLPIQIPYDQRFKERWTVELSNGYSFSRLPKGEELENEMGKFKLVCEEQKDHLVCEVELTLKGGTYAPGLAGEYNALLELWEDFKQAKWVLQAI